MRWNLGSLALLSVIALVPLASCGGGGDGDGGVNDPVTVSYSAVIEGATWWSNWSTDTTALGVFICGDGADDNGMRNYVGFNTSPLNGKTIQSATLTMGQVTNAGWGTPFADLGSIMAEHVALGPGIDDADFNSAVVSGYTGTLSTTDGSGARVVDVTAAVADSAANARTRTDFRFRFQTTTDGNSDNDYVGFAEAAGTVGGAPVPTLTVIYIP